MADYFIVTLLSEETDSKHFSTYPAAQQEAKKRENYGEEVIIYTSEISDPKQSIEKNREVPGNVIYQTAQVYSEQEVENAKMDALLKSIEDGSIVYDIERSSKKNKSVPSY